MPTRFSRFKTAGDFLAIFFSRYWKTFDAIEWLAAMLGAAKLCEASCSHVPNKGEQMVRYYGFYSNVCGCQRKKANEDGLVPCILQPEESSKGYLKNWARLIQKIGACPGLYPGKLTLSPDPNARAQWPSSRSLRPETS